MLIPYRTGRYGRNFSCRCLNRYRNWVDSYCLKYRCVSACFGHFGGFRCFSGGIFVSDRYKLKWVFIKKNCYLQRLFTIVEPSSISEILLDLEAWARCHHIVASWVFFSSSLSLSFFWHFWSRFLNKMLAEKPRGQSSRWDDFHFFYAYPLSASY